MELHPLAPIMFFTLLCLIFCGFPVAFCLGGVALIFGVLGILLEVQYMDWPFFFGFFFRSYDTMQNQILLAVPYFIFMGAILEKSKIAEELLETVGQLFGAMRGGLALAVVLVGALLAAATGVVGASVIAMGTISLPLMLRYNYSKSFSTGIIAASGTLGQIIPPSVVLVVLADQLGASVGDLFRGALIPGLLLTGLYALYVIVISFLRPHVAPALPQEFRSLTVGQLMRKVCVVMLPPLTLIFVVLGSIFQGIATPTEAGALGAVGAILLSAINGRLSRERLWQTMLSTTKLTCMVMILLIGSAAFTHVFRGLGGEDWVEYTMAWLPGGFTGKLIFANLLIFLLGFFIDFFEIAFIVLPLLAPIFLEDADNAQKAWFAVMVAMNMQTSFLTPPFGFALFYLKGVCPPEIKTAHIYKGVLPFILIQLIGLALIIAFPQLVTMLIQD